MKLLLSLTVSVLFLSLASAASDSDSVPLFSVDTSGLAVAGLSAGAFVASQYHVAFSSQLVGAGIIAGGPFYCAQDSITYATTQCMIFPSGISIPSLQLAAEECAKGSVCDSLDNLKKSKVWLFSGTADSVVNPGVVHKVVDFYSSYMSSASINGTFTIGAEHSWPTNNFGNACNYRGSPYINNCDFDASLNMLEFLYGEPLRNPVTAPTGNIHALSQKEFTPNQEDPASISLGPNAYLYVPTACVNSTTVKCRLVIAFHGCAQTLDDISFDFITKIGMNEVGEANNIAILYPQAIKAFLMSNPQGCFDWWGYSGSLYSTQKGPQMATVNNMVQYLIKQGLSLSL